MVKNNKIISFLHVLTAIFAFLFCFAEFYCGKASAEEVPLTSAKAMALIEKKSGRILYSFNEEERLPMASTTKIITAIYAIENNGDLDKIIEIPKEATNIEGTSIGLKVGEHLTIRELLYGLMLRSGNDAAVALAIATCGSEEKFVESVNEFLKDKTNGNSS